LSSNSSTAKKKGTGVPDRHWAVIPELRMLKQEEQASLGYKTEKSYLIKSTRWQVPKVSFCYSFKWQCLQTCLQILTPLLSREGLCPFPLSLEELGSASIEMNMVLVTFFDLSGKVKVPLGCVLLGKS
jgi:hypothetical protein